MPMSQVRAATRSLWNDAETRAFRGDLAQRVYTSRLLGSDQSLVLHGGGNTSVKITERNLLGEDVELLYVKGSGWDLATIEPEGFAPVRMDALLALSQLDELADAEMARQLRIAMVDPAAPAPSVEAILHAILPHRFVDHTHPDALIALMNTPSGLDRVRTVCGDDVVVVPYVMPGFLLSKRCAQEFPRQSRPGTVGMVLMHHGLFTFADTARESYERMVELVARAEEHLRANGAWDVGVPSPDGMNVERERRKQLATLRHDISSAAGRPMILSTSTNPAGLAFARRADVARVAASGPATPDHVIRTKRVPMLGRDIEGYSAAYRAYFEENAGRSSTRLTPLDPAPRIVLDPELGLISVGESASDARIAEDIYLHTIETISRAERLGAWQALPAGEIFDVEYWELEQAKLRTGRSSPPFAGEVALITGAASGIGRACVDAFLERGAAVVGLDVDAAITGASNSTAYLGIECDITIEDSVLAAFEAAARTFGGLDMLVLNAGVFPASTPVAALSLADWSRTMRVNLDANVVLLRESHPLLAVAPRGGRVVVNASKNVPAPGPGAAAYSAAKAALTQLARVTALEWGADGIRVNVVHPNAVFDTGLWTEEILRERAASYGMSVEQYRTNNVLRVEVTSRDVAAMIAEMCGPAFAKTTGAQVPVDGGHERVI